MSQSLQSPETTILSKFNHLIRILFFLFIIKPFLIVFIGISVFGKENLSALKSPFILIANHNSHLDTFTLMNLFPLTQLHHIKPVAAADYFMSNGFLKWVSTTLFNIIPISRKKISRSNNPVAIMGNAIESGHSLIVFPEGSRGEPEVVQGFKSGIAHLINKYPEVPVIPVFLKGMGRSLPKGEIAPLPLFCDVMIGEPQFYSPQCDGDKPKIVKQLEQDVEQLGEKLRLLFSDDEATQ